MNAHLPAWIPEKLAARKQVLRRLIDEYGVTDMSDDDRDFYAASVDELLDTVNRPDAPCGAYAAIVQDESNTMIYLCAGLDYALDTLADRVGEDHLNDPVGVHDLDRDELLPVRVQVKVVVDDQDS